MRAAKPILFPMAALALIAGLTSCGESGPMRPGQALSGDQALVVTSDYRTGSYAWIDLDDLEVQQSGLALHPDAVCRTDAITGAAFLIARFGSDSITVIDPAYSAKIDNQYSVGQGSNPQDMAVVDPERAYVTRLAEETLLVVHPLTGKQLGQVDLSAWADEDGLAEPGWIVFDGDKIWLALNRLVDFQPAGSSAVLRIDAASGEVEAEIVLSGTNPFARMRLASGPGKFVIGQSGRFGQLDGGVELLDPGDGSLSGFVITERALGGDITDALLLSNDKGYAVVGELQPDGSALTRLVRFDPTTGSVTGVLDQAEGFDHSFIELSPDGKQLWVTDRRRSSPGVRIFDTADDSELTQAPIDLGLPPFMICFTKINQ